MTKKVWGWAVSVAVTCVVAAASGCAARLRPTAEDVTFDSLDLDPATGSPLRISALLYRPEGASAIPYPAVVAPGRLCAVHAATAMQRDDRGIGAFA